MTKQIQLSQGKVAIVDDSELEKVCHYRWCAHRDGNTFYAVSKLPRGKHHSQKSIFMHRIIMAAPPGLEVDHKNGNGLDNRIENLRIATRAQNRQNRGRQLNNTSGYKGVGFRKRDGKWVARIMVNRQSVFLGYFDSAKDAANAYNEAATIYHGKFAQLNDVA